MDQVIKSLEKAFNEPLQDGEQRKIIFWTDYDKEYINDYENVKIENVKLVHLHENNQFYIKHLLEEEDVTSSYLVYTNLNLESDENWLYDTVLYSKTFFADRVSLIMNELQIDQSLRSTIQKYLVFFGNQERVNRFKSLIIDCYTEETIELAMMNAICRTRSLDFDTVLRTVLMDTLEDKENQYLYDFKRFFDINAFWRFVEKEYNYTRKNKTLKTLFLHLVVTTFSQTVNKDLLTTVQQFIAKRNQTNSFVFIDVWMNHRTDSTMFRKYIKFAEEELHIANLINGLNLNEYKDSDLFPYIDRSIIMYIANSLMVKHEDYEKYLQLISSRRMKHFYDEYENIYEALFYTVKMSMFKKKYENELQQGEASYLYNQYVNNFYKMDYYYRKFYVAFDKEKSNDLLLKLKNYVENLYVNWFTEELSINWSNVVRNEMLSDWTLPNVINQQSFYSTYIAPHINKNERAFVIISDAMRYEVGKELREKIDTNIVGQCTIDSMLGVVPSVTKLGMAALLPHQSLQFDQKGNVLVDGQSSSSIKERSNILRSTNGDSIVIYLSDLLNMNKQQRRDTFRGKKLIYIYHDDIDGTGDNVRTEADTFNAVEQALDRLQEAVRVIRNDLSGTYIYITADHGFIYKRDELSVTDLMTKESIETFELSRRYLLSTEQKDLQGQLTINLSNIVDNDPSLYAYVPNSTIRYRIQGGGANFVHGGTSLQEIVIPVLSIRNKRRGQEDAQSTVKTNIQLTSTMRRITNSIFSLQFFQDEKNADKIIPRTIITYMVDQEGNVISNEEKIIGDLTYDDPKERVFSIQFVLKNKLYDRDTSYYLVIKDVETDTIIERIPFTINLGIISDFDF